MKFIFCGSALLLLALGTFVAHLCLSDTPFKFRDRERAWVTESAVGRVRNGIACELDAWMWNVVSNVAREISQPNDIVRVRAGVELVAARTANIILVLPIMMLTTAVAASQGVWARRKLIANFGFSSAAAFWGGRVAAAYGLLSLTVYLFAATHVPTWLLGMPVVVVAVGTYSGVKHFPVVW